MFTIRLWQGLHILPVHFFLSSYTSYIVSVSQSDTLCKHILGHKAILCANTYMYLVNREDPG
jgi:hypothetical protein